MRILLCARSPGADTTTTQEDSQAQVYPLLRMRLQVVSDQLPDTRWVEVVTERCEVTTRRVARLYAVMCQDLMNLASLVSYHAGDTMFPRCSDCHPGTDTACICMNKRHGRAFRKPRDRLINNAAPLKNCPA